MKFGKHKNQPIRNLPTEYIEWFCQNISGHDDIKGVMQTVLLARWGKTRPQQPQKNHRKSPSVGTETQREMFPLDPPPMPRIKLIPWDGVSAPF